MILAAGWRRRRRMAAGWRRMVMAAGWRRMRMADGWRWMKSLKELSGQGGAAVVIISPWSYQSRGFICPLILLLNKQET